MHDVTFFKRGCSLKNFSGFGGFAFMKSQKHFEFYRELTKKKKGKIITNVRHLKI